MRNAASAPGLGSIPARAGQPTTPALTVARCRVHPRSRGAAVNGVAHRTNSKGPSPLARGSHSTRCPFSRLLRSIPARAGQPVRAHGAQSRVGVHPRSRGAAVCRRQRCAASEGPSPLARGSPCPAIGVMIGDGSIPARAGQPVRTRITSGWTKVHPRSRGAAAMEPRHRTPASGPSPLARGSL